MQFSISPRCRASLLHRPRLTELEEFLRIIRALTPEHCTVGVVIHSTDLIDDLKSSALVASLFDAVEEIVDGSMRTEATPRSDFYAVGLDAAAVYQIGSAVAVQFRMALGSTASDEDRRDLAIAVNDESSSLRRSSAEALGAIMLIVEAILIDDSDTLNEVVRDAIEIIDSIDLFEAAASVAAAITWNIADRLALDPVTVVHELGNQFDGCASSAARSDRSTVRQSGRSGRQTWSGRNSQCHGSRGTDSTQPNRGPLVFSH